MEGRQEPQKRYSRGALANTVAFTCHERAVVGRGHTVCASECLRVVHTILAECSERLRGLAGPIENGPSHLIAATKNSAQIPYTIPIQLE